MPTSLTRQPLFLATTLLISLSMLMLTSTAHAQTSVALTNPSFEIDSNGNPYTGGLEDFNSLYHPSTTPPSTWGYYSTNGTAYGTVGHNWGNNGVFVKDLAATDGGYALFLASSGAPQGVFQPITGGLVPDSIYTLLVDIGLRSFGTDTPYEIGLKSGSTGENGAGTVLGTATTGTVLSSGGGGQITAPITVSYNFTTDATGVSNAFLYVNNNGANFSQLSVDNVRLSYAAIPEPGTLVLLTLGMASAGLARRRSTNERARRTNE
jgi:PEP-CTERM motif